MMNRYVLIINRKDIDVVRKGLNKLNCHISSISCSQDGYMVIYRSEDYHDIDEVKEFGCL